ncbi:MAG: DUF1501 domain-containing protein [Saprospiraceae bacterium]|nr:DUF1501 domain-containing protein [Saprospiraceae bacterium]
MYHNKLKRRNFIQTLSCAGIGYATLYNSLLNLKSINALAASNSAMDPEYKALVCIFMSGGNDSFNMLIPTTTDEYNTYKISRTGIAIPKNELLPLTVSNTPGREFALHPSLPFLQKKFNDNNLAFVSNIGTLIEPTTKQKVYDVTAKLPLGLFSHSDQMLHWQTGISSDRSSIGWGGKIADLIKDMNKSSDFLMNISLSGTNLYQLGNETVEFSLDPERGSTGITGYGEITRWDYLNNARTAAIDSLLAHNYDDAFQNTYINVIRQSRDAHIKFSDALEKTPDITTQFSENYLSQSMKMISRTMSAHQELGVKRQIFFVDFYGWDHHDESLENHQEMLSNLDTMLEEFNNALIELKLENQVSIFSVSEFGRSLSSNGNGTDHGWGGNVFALGGPVNGGKIYGKYPSLDLNADENIYESTLIPSTPVDLYFAELALWMGVSRSDLNFLFPNLATFYNINSSSNPLGLLKL